MNYKDWYSKVINKEQDKEQPSGKVYNNMTWNEWLDYIGDNYQEMEEDIEEVIF